MKNSKNVTPVEQHQASEEVMYNEIVQDELSQELLKMKAYSFVVNFESNKPSCNECDRLNYEMFMQIIWRLEEKIFSIEEDLKHSNIHFFD